MSPTYYLSGGYKFLYKRNANTNQMVPIGKSNELEDGTATIDIFYPQNKTFNSCNFLNLYTPEFYISLIDRDTINWSEYYYFDNHYKKLTSIKYVDGWIQQIEFDKYVLGYILGTGIPSSHNAMIWLYDQFLDEDMFSKQTEQNKSAASIKTVYGNILEKLYNES